MPSRISWHLSLTIFLLAATLGASRITAHRKTETLEEPLETISQNILGFSGTDNPNLNDETLAQLKPTSYLSRRYRKGGMEGDLFVAFYGQQRAGESMHSPKHCLPGAGWEIWDYGNTDIPVNGREYRVNQYRISREGQRLIVLYWYQSKGRIIASEFLGKFLLARDALLQNETGGSIVRFIVPDTPSALQAGREFVAALIPQIQRSFGG